MLISPLEKRFYCEGIRTDKEYPACGINALAHYTWLNPDPERMLMLTSKEYRSLKSAEAFDSPNVFDGKIIVEVWKYPVIKMAEENKEWVDRLSLALSLGNDDDPRIEKEVERMINDIQWKD